MNTNWVANKLQKFISYRSRGWEVQDYMLADPVSGEGLHFSFTDVVSSNGEGTNRLSKISCIRVLLSSFIRTTLSWNNITYPPQFLVSSCWGGQVPEAHRCNPCYLRGSQFQPSTGKEVCKTPFQQKSLGMVCSAIMAGSLKLEFDAIGQPGQKWHLNSKIAKVKMAGDMA
jgi:hypothetical protein